MVKGVDPHEQSTDFPIKKLSRDVITVKSGQQRRLSEPERAAISPLKSERGNMERDPDTSCD